jgi:hypothetical protein
MRTTARGWRSLADDDPGAFFGRIDTNAKKSLTFQQRLGGQHSRLITTAPSGRHAARTEHCPSRAEDAAARVPLAR